MRRYESEVDNCDESVVPMVLAVIAVMLFIFGMYMLCTL